MNSSLRRIDKNKVNNLKKFFENLVCSSEKSNSIQADKNNNNSNESTLTSKSLGSEDALVKTHTLSDSKQFKIKNEIKTKSGLSKKAKIPVAKADLKSDQISIRSLSEYSLISNFLSDQDPKDNANTIPVIYEAHSHTQNKNDPDTKISKLLDQDQKQANFGFNLFKLLKLMLTAKCYCVLLTEKQNSSDLKKLIFILYEMKQTALKKLSNVDSSEIESAKLNDFLLADLFNLLCEVHSEIIKLDGRFKRIIISKKRMNKEVVDELFTRINLIVYKILSMQKILCMNKSDNSEQSCSEFQSHYESQIKVCENDNFKSLKEFYRKKVMSPEFRKFMKCSYNYECSQKELRSSFIDLGLLKDVKSLIEENFAPKYAKNFKLPKLSLSKSSFMHKKEKNCIREPSLITITSSNISNLTFQNANSEFENNSNNNCCRKFAASNNSEASFVAMLKLNNDVSKFLVYKNKPRNQFISFKRKQRQIRINDHKPPTTTKYQQQQTTNNYL
ncbi:hypothetical protein BpHYR1_000504 [Brachionus plicatilis]|uniref:Uncharacterized protein n=1 Tax=Brachionus plicatilis TaxID=10195 RepID=A0A3M7R1C7_BRAPC|nr:hypothetical protein BpHYR1_000504 [Brachionus plicatilis]